MTKDEALKMALEALEDLGMKHYESTGEVLYKETFTAINEALAQLEQEPVAWISHNAGLYHFKPDESLDPLPLYLTPPQRKPLSDEEIVLIVAECAASHQHTDIHFARAIEAALRSKNT